MQELYQFFSEEDGVGVIELVLILVVLIEAIFKEINNQSKEVY